MSILYFFSILCTLACHQNPWQDIYDREMVFRQALIHEHTDINLPEITSSSPITHAPRIIIRKDRIEFDNRVWWLSSPDVFFLDHYDLENMIGPCRRYECQKKMLIEERVLDLDNGYIKEEDRDGNLVPKIQEVLERQKQNHLSLWNLYGYEEEGELEDTNTFERLEDSEQAYSDLGKLEKKFSEEGSDPGLHDFRFTGTIHIFVDEDVPYQTVSDVIFGVMQTEYHNSLLVALKEEKFVAVKTNAREWNELRFYNGDKEELVIQSNQCSLIPRGNFFSIHCDKIYTLMNAPVIPHFIKGGTCEDSTDWKGLLDGFRSFQNSCFENAERSPQYTVKTNDDSYNRGDPLINDAFVWYLVANENDTYGDQIAKIEKVEQNFPQWAAYHYPLYRRNSKKKDNPSGIHNCSNMVDVSNLSDDERKLLCHLLFQVGTDIPDYQNVFPELHAIRMKEIQRNSLLDKDFESAFGIEKSFQKDNFMNQPIGTGIKNNSNSERKKEQ